MREQKNVDEQMKVPELETVPEGFHSAVMGALAEIEKAESGRGAVEEMSKRAWGHADGKTRNVPAGRRIFKKGALIPLAAALCLTVGGTVFAAANLYQQRMEAMNQEMLEEFYAQAYVGETFHYSRDLTDAERSRFDALSDAYENSGRFPEKSLSYLDKAEEYDGKGIGLYAARSTLFLPEGELSDEELLQLIDFQHKIVYSISRISEQAEENGGEYPAAVQAVPAADGSSIVAYEGDVEAICMAESGEYLYLAGDDVIGRVKIGGGTSEPFYAADFGADMRVCAMEADQTGGLYVSLGALGASEGNGKLLRIGGDGAPMWEKSLAASQPAALAVDGNGRVYVQDLDGGIAVYDGDGAEVCTLDIPYEIAAADSMCRGKDGSVYLLAEENELESVILRLDPETKKGVVAAGNLHPVLEAHDHSLFAGKDSDFVIWNMEGIYTYDLGDESAERVLELYEAPLNWEGAQCAALEDGRLVFMKAFESVYDGNEYGLVTPVPESIRFFYVGLEE